MQSRNVADSGKSNIIAILSNFKYKKDMSDNSVEHTVYKRFVDFDNKDSSKSLVENRRDALKWILDIQQLSNEVDYSINKRKLMSGTSDNKELIEQDKIRLLHNIGWYYNGDFYTPTSNNNDTVGYPNLSFNISTRKIDGGGNEDDPIFMYMASYGIVSNKDDKSNGSYSLFLTMDECIKFIVNELEYTHKDILYRKEMNKLFKEKNRVRLEAAANEKDRRKATIDLFMRFSSDEKNKEIVRKNLERLVSNANVEKEIYKLQRSSDISSLSDFINEFMIRMARNSVKDAIEHEQEAKRAGAIIQNYDTDRAQDSTPGFNEASAVKSMPNSNAPLQSHKVEEPRKPVLSVSSPIRKNSDSIRKDYNPSPQPEKVENDPQNVPVSPVTASVDQPKKKVSKDEEFTDVDLNNISHSVVSTTTSDDIVIHGEHQSETNTDFDDMSINGVENVVVSDNFDDVNVSPVTSNTVTSHVANDIVNIDAQHSKEVYDKVDDFDLSFTSEEDKVFHDEDVLKKIQEVMPDFFDPDRTPIIDNDSDDSVDSIINKF